MKENLRKEYSDSNDIFGYPQKYKGKPIYPILLKDVQQREEFYQLFCHPKSYIASRDILKMSYLKFILYAIQSSLNPEGQEILEYLIDFLKYIFKSEKVSLEFQEVPGDGIFSFILLIRVDDITFTEEDFDDIREIVLEQNGLSIGYIEDYNPEMEKLLNFNNRKSDDLSLLDEVFTFCAVMKLSLHEIEGYTIFQFKNAMEKIMVLKEFDLYKPLLISGQIELKSGQIKHYLYHSVKSGRYDSIKIAKEEFIQSNDIMKLPGANN